MKQFAIETFRFRPLSQEAALHDAVDDALRPKMAFFCGCMKLVQASIEIEACLVQPQNRPLL